MSTWGASCYNLLVASFSHYGKPITDNCCDISMRIWQVMAEYDPATAMIEITTTARQPYHLAFQAGGALLPDGAAQIGFKYE